jgi:predicted nuclease with TOPRIM domain
MTKSLLARLVAREEISDDELRTAIPDLLNEREELIKERDEARGLVNRYRNAATDLAVVNRAAIANAKKAEAERNEARAWWKNLENELGATNADRDAAIARAEKAEALVEALSAAPKAPSAEGWRK